VSIDAGCDVDASTTVTHTGLNVTCTIGMLRVIPIARVDTVVGLIGSMGVNGAVGLIRSMGVSGAVACVDSRHDAATTSRSRHADTALDDTAPQTVQRVGDTSGRK
jgi:hypothetical protein